MFWRSQIKFFFTKVCFEDIVSKGFRPPSYILCKHLTYTVGYIRTLSSFEITIHFYKMPVCKDCSRVYKNSASLRAHRHNIHKNNSRVDPYSTNSSNKMTQINPTNGYKCEHCNATYSTLTSLYTHKAEDHPVKNDNTIALVDHNKDVEHADTDSDESTKSNDTREDSDGSTKSNDKTIDHVLPTPRQQKRNFDGEDLNLIEHIKRKKESDDSDGDIPYRTRERMVNRYKIMYRKCQSDLKKLRSENRRLIDELTNNDMKWKEVADKYERGARSLQDVIASLQEKIIVVEREKKNYKEKIGEQQNYITELKESKGSLPHFNSISKDIYNCVSISEIRRVHKLFRKNMLNGIADEKNIKVIQRIFSGLFNGVIPVCNPQRSVLTESQLEIMDKIRSSSVDKAQKILRDNMQVITKIFGYIDTSLKTAVDLFYEYGSKDEDDPSSEESGNGENDSDVETIDEVNDNESSSDDEGSVNGIDTGKNISETDHVKTTDEESE